MRAFTPRLPDVREGILSLPKGVRLVLGAAVVVFVYLLPIINPPFLTTEDNAFGNVLFLCAIYALVAVGLNIVIGYAGLLDLGYVGFFAIGAYAVAVWGSLHAQLGFFALVPIAIVVTLVSGLILGWPTLRVRGDYLAIVTLGFGEIIRLVLLNTEWLGGARGISNVPSPPSLELFSIPHLDWSTGTPVVDLDTQSTFLKFDVTDAVPYYWLTLSILFVILLLDRLLQDSRVGRAWESTREDEDAAELMGVPTFRFKLLAFATGAAIGGLSGALFGAKQQFVNPESFTIIYSVLFVAMVVVGGQGSRWGVIVAAFLLIWLPEKFRFLNDARFLLFGLALIALANFRPQGLLPPRRRQRPERVGTPETPIEEGEARA